MDVFGLLALVLAPGGVIVVLMERFRRENAKDHNATMQTLERVETKVEKIDERMDHHIEWHLDGDRKKG